MPSNKAPQTIAVSNGIDGDSAFGAVTPPEIAGNATALKLEIEFPLSYE